MQNMSKNMFGWWNKSDNIENINALNQDFS